MSDTIRSIKAVVSLAIAAAIAPTLAAARDAQHLYGIHWWGSSYGVPIDTAPRALLNVPTNSAWDTEVVLTNSADWWKAWWYTDLYSTLYAWNVTPITRVDYTWDDTIPPPLDASYGTWPTKYVNEVVNTLRHACHLWVVGNEPNIVQGPASLWPNRRISPAEYAKVYRAVRQAVRSQALIGPPGQHLVLIAGPSPGGVEGPRWMSGTTYLRQVLEAIPADEVDGLAIHAYGWNVPEFANGYREQLAVIDSLGLQQKPVWITEFNRYTQSNADEANSASFVRGAFADVHMWNSVPGNHNVIGMTWFVYDGNNQAGGGWNPYSIEYWRDNGYPAGDPRDLYTAFKDAVNARYPAGKWLGVRTPADIINPGFEQGNTNGWGYWGQADGAQTGPWYAEIQPQSGQYFFGTVVNGGAKNGGIFQRVAAKNGRIQVASASIRTYKLGGTSSTKAESRIGIDPTGNVDPAASRVVWGAWTESQGAWKTIQVSRAAEATSVTVFIEHRQSPSNTWNINCVDNVKRVERILAPPPGTRSAPLP